MNCINTFEQLNIIPKCNCLTKTPEADFHDKGCPVWLADRLMNLADESKAILDLLWHPSLDGDETVIQPLQDAYDKVVG